MKKGQSRPSSTSRLTRRSSLRSLAASCVTSTSQVETHICNIWWCRSICTISPSRRSEAKRREGRHTKYSRSSYRQVLYCTVSHHLCTFLIANRAKFQIWTIQRSESKQRFGRRWPWSLGPYRNWPTLSCALPRVQNATWAFLRSYIRWWCLAC